MIATTKCISGIFEQNSFLSPAYIKGLHQEQKLTATVIDGSGTPLAVVP
jgi:hypothetical protein